MYLSRTKEQKDSRTVFANNYYEIMSFFDYYTIRNNRRFYEKDIVYLSDEQNNDGKYSFNVHDETNNKTYRCLIGVGKKLNINEVHCDCNKSKYYGACNHIYYCFFYYSNIIFQERPEDVEVISKRLLKKYSTNISNVIQKEVFLTVKIFSNVYEDSDYVSFDLKVDIGVDKTYALLAHFSRFLSAYTDDTEECCFGTKFTYNSNEYFFSEKSKKLISLLSKHQYEINRKDYTKEFITEIIDLVKNDTFYFDNHIITKVVEGFPIKTLITKEDNKILVNFEEEDFVPVGDNYEYVYNSGTMYHLNQKGRKLIKDLIDNKCDKLVLNSNKLDTFVTTILPIIKKNTTVEETLKDDIKIVENVEAELYFDLNSKNIIVNVELIYDERINYFDDKKGLLRDTTYETEIINTLISYGFSINDKKIILDDIDKMVSFIDDGLAEISTKYTTFTTEKFKNVNIKRKTNIRSTFGIGQDNILNYSFGLDGIDSDELVNIFKNIKNKKKYYRLKNGDILNLEDDNLKQLNDLSDDMELTDEEIIKGKGEILKYRAIYLDSLKDNKYNIIETDNLFSNFIDNFKAYKSCEIDLSKNDLKILRDYQVTGVKWLYNLDKTGFGGILADEMGLGKTIQVIFYIKQILKEDINARFLIVVPTSLLYNWKHEFEMFGKEIDICVLSGNKSARENSINEFHNVYITTYGVLREDELLYEEMYFHTVIIDEAQNIKNYLAGISKSVKKIKSNVRIALTGTPIENSVLELWSIFDFIMPGYLSNVQKFQNKYKFKSLDDEETTTINNLSNLINPFILRRKKKDVVKELPEKIENNIFIELAEEQKKIYVAELERVKKQIDEIMKSGGMGRLSFLILPLLTKLRQICIDPSIIYEDYNYSSAKIDTFVDIVKESVSNGHKILVFTSFLGALNIAQEKLKKEKIDSFRIDGSVSSSERMKRVDEFNSDNCQKKVFFIMLKSGGTGLNLATSDVVIHLDLWWNPQAENQATDRAHRIGQKNVVEVIKIITKGTIEERILELQNKKRALSDKLIDGKIRNENVIEKLSEEDIKSLLAYDNK